MPKANAPTSVTNRIVVTRADGRVEDYGMVGYWHRNPLRRWAWRVSRAAWWLRYREGYRNG